MEILPSLPSDDGGDDENFDEVYERDPDAVVHHESLYFMPQGRWQWGFFQLHHVAWDLLGHNVSTLAILKQTYSITSFQVFYLILI